MLTRSSMRKKNPFSYKHASEETFSSAVALKGKTEVYVWNLWTNR